MPTVPTIEPVEIRAGDTVKFKVTGQITLRTKGGLSLITPFNSTDTSTATATVEADGSAS